MHIDCNVDLFLVKASLFKGKEVCVFIKETSTLIEKLSLCADEVN